MEHFRFDVRHWSFDYSMRLDPDWKSGDILSRSWEQPWLELRGPLRSRTKRRIRTISLRLDPSGIPPEEWKPEVRGFGTVLGKRCGVMDVLVPLPPQTFQTLFLATSVGRIREVSLSIDFEGATGLVRWFSVSDHREEDAE